MKTWITKAIAYLDKSLGKIPSELNEIDWKITLSPNNDKLCKHIAAFANLPGGGFLAFGIDNKTGKVFGITKADTDGIIERLASLCRDGVDPLVSIDHSIETFRGEELLFVYVKESAIKPVPSNIPEIIKWLEDEKMIIDVDGKGYYITNFGAIAAAKDLTKFDGLSRKAVRLIKYEGKNKAAGSKEYPGTKGYAIGFEGLIQFVKGLLPGSEVIKNSLRQETGVYPEIALRELIANILIHQDFTIRGTGPMIEIFEDRIEFTNPGKLLPSKKLDRLIRTTPESRNEILASAFRRYNICEERGSGFQGYNIFATQVCRNVKRGANRSLLPA